MENQNVNHSGFLLNARTLRLTIYACLVIGNVLFAIWYPEDKLVGILGALFFVMTFIIAKRRGQKPVRPLVVRQHDKSIPVDRKS